MQAPVELAMLSTAVFLGGLVSGFSGFAFSAAAGAILLHVFEPIAAIPLMMFCSIASQTMSLVKVYRLIRWRELAPLLIGGMAGAAVAVPFMATVHPHAFRIAFGVFLASYALYMLTRHLLIRRPLTLAADAASVPALSVVGILKGANPGDLPVDRLRRSSGSSPARSQPWICNPMARAAGSTPLNVDWIVVAGPFTRHARSVTVLLRPYRFVRRSFTQRGGRTFQQRATISHGLPMHSVATCRACRLSPHRTPRLFVAGGQAQKGRGPQPPGAGAPSLSVRT